MDLCGVSRARGVRWFLEWLDSPSDDLMSRTNEPMVYRLCSQCHVGLVQTSVFVQYFHFISCDALGETSISQRTDECMSDLKSLLRPENLA